MIGPDNGSAAAGMPAATAYPRLLRIFFAGIALAALCGLAALATQGSTDLHPAPFLVLAMLSAIAAFFAFAVMLLCVAGSVAIAWWRTRKK